jgi:hypothetical protein
MGNPGDAPKLFTRAAKVKTSKAELFAPTPKQKTCVRMLFARLPQPFARWAEVKTGKEEVVAVGTWEVGE